MWTEARPGSSRGADKCRNATPHILMGPTLSPVTSQASMGHPSSCLSPHPHTSCHFRTHTGAIPVTSLCTHIPVCMAPRPGSRLVRHTLGAAWLGWWPPAPSVSPLPTPFRHQHAHAFPEPGSFLLLLYSQGDRRPSLVRWGKGRRGQEPLTCDC